tara:strand:- start:8037 stop:8984 length:948 start_codon:yes stop_codon:yes gene_type:complete
MSLNKHFAAHTLSQGNTATFPPQPDIVEVASGLFEGHSPQVTENTVLCIQACPSQLGEGDVSSNLRHKHDNEKNNQGCEKWLEILTSAGSVYSTTLSREERMRMYKMNEDGTIDVYNKQKDEVPEEKETLKNFLEHFGMDTERVKVMKVASAYGATYMADMLSLIMTMETMFNTGVFKSKWFSPEVVKAGSGRIQPVEKEDGKIWTPIEGNDYLYFTPSAEGEGVKIMKYGGDFSDIYSKLQELLSLEENEAKADLRKMFGFCSVYTRYSDVWINDIDDALTIYMILNAYSHTTLSEGEEKVKSQLEGITSTFFQ